MTDPLSVTFGVVGVAAVVLHSARRLREFIDSIEGAPKAVSRLSVDVSAIENILEVLDSKFKSPDFARNHGFTQMIQLLEAPLRNCEGVLKVISDKLHPYVKLGDGTKLSRWRSFTWTYREKDFQDLQALLVSYKATLEIAISTATLMNTTSGFQDVRHQIRKLRQQLNADDESIEISSSAGSVTVQTDYNFALKRFLLDIESAVDENDSLRNTQDTPPHLVQSGQTRGRELGDAGPVTLPKLDEDVPSQSDIITEISCLRDGCIIPDILASGMLTLDQFDNQVISGIHLYGYKSGPFVQPSSTLDVRYAVALCNFAPSEPSNLAFEQHDVIQILDTCYEGWSTGRLGSSLGSVPDKYLAPCQFRVAEANRLAHMLQYHSLANHPMCKSLVLAMSSEHKGMQRAVVMIALKRLSPLEANDLLAILQSLQGTEKRSRMNREDYAFLVRKWFKVLFGIDGATFLSVGLQLFVHLVEALEAIVPSQDYNAKDDWITLDNLKKARPSRHTTQTMPHPL